MMFAFYLIMNALIVKNSQHNCADWEEIMDYTFVCVCVKLAKQSTKII